MAEKNPNGNDSGSVRINSKHIYEVVTRMEREVIQLLEVKEKVEDHENRLREIEKTVWKSSWVSGLVAAVVTSAATASIIGVIVSA